MSLELSLICDGCGSIGTACNAKRASPATSLREEAASEMGWTYARPRGLAKDYCRECSKRYPYCAPTTREEGHNAG